MLETTAFAKDGTQKRCSDTLTLFLSVYQFCSQFPDNIVCQFVEKCMICVPEWANLNPVTDRVIPKSLV